MGGNVMGWVKGNSDQVWGLQITHSCHMYRCMFVLWLAEKKSMANQNMCFKCMFAIKLQTYVLFKT